VSAWARAGGAVVALYGAALAVAGGALWQAGGTPGYFVAGVGTALAGLLLALRHRAALPLYALVLLATSAWAWAETGGAVWRLLPRLGLPVVVGWWLVAAWGLQAAPRRRRAALGACAASALAAAGWLAGLPFDAPSGGHGATGPALAGVATWRHYGQDLAGTRYSAAAQLTPANVGRLQPLWQFATGEDPARSPDPRNLPAFEATPLQVGHTLFLCTPRNQVIALDVATGRERWRHDPQTQLKGNFYLVTCRGVAYHESAAAECPRRILAATLDARLLALDADTGRPCRGFGRDGTVSLREHQGEILPGFYGVTSAPTVAGGAVIVGGLVLDNFAVDVPSGVVRAFDAVTGQPRWAWDSGRVDAQALREGEVYTRGAPNAWAPFSADESLGLVYLPTGNPSPDYFGGLRSAAMERHGSAVVALDLQTGRPRWTFQTVHHDLWDYDTASQPTLVDLPDPQGGAARVPALVQPTKRGELFVLDRRDGRPLYGVEERPVPGGAVAGDHTAPTQPYPVGVPSLAPPPLTEAAMWGLTPFDEMWCRRRFLAARHDGPFAPPSLQGTVVFPNNMGASSWGSVAIDPVRGLLVANTSYTASIVRLFPRAEGERRRAAGLPLYNPMAGTPYIADALQMLSPLGLPCNAPPWGLLTAIDLVQRKVAWQQPFGTTAQRAPLGIAAPMGLPSSGGAVVTAGGLTFIGSADDGWLRAFETASGRLLWRARLPAVANATPMVATLPDGRQAIVVSAGGHTYLGTRRGDQVLAFALPAGAP